MRLARTAVLLLFTLSGLGGLIYEIVWIRQLSHLLGGTSYSISIVLAAFMGGLALGSRHFGRRADESPRPLLFYAKLEFGIGALGILVHLLISNATPVYVALAGALPAALLGPLRVLIAAALILPPTFLMGGTLPVLSRFVVRDRNRLGRGLGLLYAVNTLGAVLGSLVTGFVLIATVGLAGSIVIAVALNFLIGVLVLLLERAIPAAGVTSGPATTEIEGEKKEERSAPELSGTVLALVFALSGFASLGYELYWTRALQHFLGNSTYAFSAMLATFLTGLTLGAWAGGRAADRAKSPARLLGWIQYGVAAAALLTVTLIWEILPRIASSAWLSGDELGWTSYLLRRFALCFLVMIPATFLTGMTFPIVNRIGIRTLSGLGRGVGALYFANTVGAILGSLAAGFLLLALLGAKGALIATALLSVVIGLVVHLANRGTRSREQLIAVALMLGLFISAPLLHRSGRSLLADSQSAGDKVLLQVEDYSGETRVYRKRSGDIHMSVDGHHIGGTEPAITRKEKILAHLPMLLRPDAHSVLAVGLGTGITLGTLALYDQLSSLAVVEIVPGVVRGARFFAAANGRVLQDPRLDLHLGDGIQHLLTTRERFDIISSDSKLNPEYVGNAPLLAADYYEICRERLTEGGVMVQWLGCHLPNPDLRVIARSFARVFPHVGVYWYDPNNLILAGSKAPLRFSLDAARKALNRESIAADLRALHLADPYALATLWICDRDGLLASLGEGPLSTWNRPRIEFTMSRNFRRLGSHANEDENLRWLNLMQDFGSQQVLGDVDGEILGRYEFAASMLVAGFAAGGGSDRLESGARNFEQGVATNPGDPRLTAVLARMRGEKENIEAALASDREQTPEELARMGLLRQDQGKHTEALELLDRALAGRPADPDIQYGRLLSLRALGRSDRFTTGLTRFLEQFPQDARGHSLQGRQLAGSGRMEEALRAFERASTLNPGNPIVENNLASTLARLGRFGDAAAAFEKVCALQPGFQGAALSVAACYSLAGRPEASARWARRCIAEKLVTPAQFRDDPRFAILRESKYWDTERGAPRPGPERE